jgi:hypothetical protein
VHSEGVAAATMISERTAPPAVLAEVTVSLHTALGPYRFVLDETLLDR